MMHYSVRASISQCDPSDPLEEFFQVCVGITRDDGKTLSWRGEKIPRARSAVGFPSGEAIASAVEAMLKDPTVVEFVGLIVRK